MGHEIKGLGQQEEANIELIAYSGCAFSGVIQTVDSHDFEELTRNRLSHHLIQKNKSCELQSGVDQRSNLETSDSDYYSNISISTALDGDNMALMELIRNILDNRTLSASRNTVTSVSKSSTTTQLPHDWVATAVKPHPKS